MNQELRDKLINAGIDLDSSLRAQKSLETTAPLETTYHALDPKDSRVIDVRSSPRLPLTKAIQLRLRELLPWFDYKGLVKTDQGTEVLDQKALDLIGLELLPQASFGILNGGAATSYVDKTRNQTVFGSYFESVKDFFAKHAPPLTGVPKALAPAFYQTNGEPGPSFIELKLDHMEAMISRYHSKTTNPQGATMHPLLPWVQLASKQGRPILDSALETWQAKGNCHTSLVSPLTGEQNLLAAFAPNPGSGGWEFFLDDKHQKPLGLPGGHGQVWHCLQEQLQELRKLGKRYVWLGNIDNIAFTPNTIHLALTALTAVQGSFEFSYKTSLDTKGGILVGQENGRLSCADIGMAIKAQDVKAMEETGSPILFNCASGLFDIDWVVENAEAIMAGIPLRQTLSKKDLGTYITVEQSAWEILNLMEKPLILAVEKSKRFLANKFLLDGYLTSGINHGSIENPELREAATLSNKGLEALLKDEFAYHCVDGNWIKKPKP